VSRDPVRRRTLDLVHAVAVAAAGLVGVFYVARDAPAASPCDGRATGEVAAIHAYKAGSVPLHLLGAALILAAVVRLSAATRGGGRPGLATAVAATVYAALLAATAFAPDVYAFVGFVGFVFLLLAFFTFPPATVAVAVVAVVLLLAMPSRRPASGKLVLAAGWVVLALVLPLHYAAVRAVGDAWFCD
jgi:hypothetical protein